jgi:hypothetical protein
MCAKTRRLLVLVKDVIIYRSNVDAWITETMMSKCRPEFHEIKCKGVIIGYVIIRWTKHPLISPNKRRSQMSLTPFLKRAPGLE